MAAFVSSFNLCIYRIQDFLRTYSQQQPASSSVLRLEYAYIAFLMALSYRISFAIYISVKKSLTWKEALDCQDIFVSILAVTQGPAAVPAPLKIELYFLSPMILQCQIKTPNVNSIYYWCGEHSPSSHLIVVLPWNHVMLWYSWCHQYLLLLDYPAGIHRLKVNNRNTGTRENDAENDENDAVSHLVRVFLLLTLNKQLSVEYEFYVLVRKVTVTISQIF